AALLNVAAEYNRAEEEKKIAQAVKDFLQNKLLAQADTWTQADALVRAGESSSGAKPNLTIRELLDRAAKQLAPDKIEESFVNEGLDSVGSRGILASTYAAVGNAHLALALCQEAEEVRQDQLGLDDPERLDVFVMLAHVYQPAGKLDVALPLFEEELKLDK